MTIKAYVERVASGLVFPEGPVWHPDGFLLFSDVHGGTIEKLREPQGTTTWWDVGKKTNGLIMSPDGKKILACCYSERELLEIDAATKQWRILANECDGQAFLNVNDVAVASNGEIYFSDPCWDPAYDSLQAVYAVLPSGEVRCAARIRYQPNGLVVSPDEKWIFVARSGAHDILRFKRSGGGSLTGGEVWAKLPEGAEPDGMTVDREGRLYVALAGTGQLQILSPTAETLGVIDICGRMATNCEFSGAEPNVLFVTGGGRRDAKIGGVWKVVFE
ncbi:MAG: SMP-30/gluconolactonase/LRE family protein [Candidatus Sumerlaeaceae bacterium]|nr:SMP-30/gluconolactonase/LRE family protein [Candidatus Sumerlaeaceae bacterium]